MRSTVEMNMIITNIYHQLLSMFVCTELKSNTRLSDVLSNVVIPFVVCRLIPNI